MILRAATAGDVEALFDIRCSVLENHQSRDELAAIGVTVESVAQMIDSGDYVAVVAEAEGVPVGFTMAQISQGYVFACFVRPAFERRGVGRALMHATEAKLRAAGVERLWLSTGGFDEPHVRALGFYRHLGWVEDGRLDDGQVVFRKRLSGA